MPENTTKLLGAEELEAARNKARELHELYPAGDATDVMIREVWGMDPEAVFAESAGHAPAEALELITQPAFMAGFERAVLLLKEIEVK